jgi:hypothetical protein
MLIALAGCGQIAIKRGSGADALAADRTSCREQDADPAAIRACLVQHGWHITDLDGGSAAPPAFPFLDTAKPAPADAPPATAQQGTASAPSIQPVPVQAPSEIRIGNWWHFGGGPADLHASVDACVAKLGPADRPDAGYHTVSSALYACLSAGGWRRLGPPAKE